MKSLSNKTALVTAWALCLCGSFLVFGCGSGTDAGKTIPADSLAVSDPDAKGKELLAEFDALGIDDRESWVHQHEFALAVFESTKDPELRSRYQKDIAPFCGAK